MTDSDGLAIRRLQDAVRRLAGHRAPTGRSHHDADDTTGTVGTDDAIGFDPLPLLRTLDECGANVVVIGQVAGIMHGSRELTGDLDLLWDGDQGAALLVAFARHAAQLTDEDGGPVELTPAAFQRPKVMFRTVQASGDCCTPDLPWGAVPVASLLRRQLVVTASEGFRIRYVARDDLIAMRRAVGRIKDLRRAAELEALGRCEVPPTPMQPSRGDGVG